MTDHTTGWQSGWNAVGVPQPGGIPLRPLGVGDILNGAVTALRRNPGATVGLAAIVFAIAGVISTTATLIVTRHGPGTQGSMLGWSVGISALPSLIAQVILTGILTAVIGRGMLGERAGIGQAWQLVKGRLPAVLGVTLLTGLILVAMWIPWAVILAALIAAHLPALAAIFGILGFLATAVLAIAAWIRLSLAAPVVVLERRQPRAALRRSWQLVRRSTWRLLGIYLLTVLVVIVAQVILEVPFEIARFLVSGGFTGSGPAAGVIIGAVGGIVVGAITRPLLAGVTVLIYVDLRMRREGLDLIVRGAPAGQRLSGEAVDRLWREPAAGSPVLR
jgi:Membrane domain of glycerophosphoryl diester phosphodiesterase